jgi:serpin B
MKGLGIPVLCAIVFVFESCSENPLSSEETGGDKDTPFAVSKSNKVIRETGSKDNADIQAQSINRFALNMYKTMIEQGVVENNENLLFSPYSMVVALAMACAGADGETESQMREALSVALEGDLFHKAINGLDQELMGYTQTVDGVTLNVVNSAWMEMRAQFTTGFLNTLSRYYGAGVNLLDFMGQPEESRIIINDWVEEQTNGKICDLIPQGSIDGSTELVLTNAIYFLADWLSSFNPELTETGDFYCIDNSTVAVPLMNLNDSNEKVKMLYKRGSNVRVMDFPYEGDRLVMTVLLPDRGSFSEFETSMTLEKIDQLIAELDSTELPVQLPKFEFTTSSISIKDVLVAMGMVDAFSPGIADFSKIDGTRGLYISDVLHKAFISVDESGTEAAAATAIVFERVSTDVPYFNANHPFIYLIRDRETQTILFIGRTMNPSLSE